MKGDEVLEASSIVDEIKQSKPFPSKRQEAYVALLRTADDSKRFVTQVLEPSGVTLQQYNVLRILRGAGEGGLPTLTVGSRMEPGLLANTVSNRLRPKLEAMAADLPSGYFVEIDGELEETEKAQLQVVGAVGLSILLMFLVLTAQYNSVLKPIVIMAAVPLGLIGVLIGLFVTGWAMGFMAMLGILSLGGIVINNAIILVDFIESNVAQGQELRRAVADAGRVRIRPIVLTTLTTIGGLLPLSLFGGALFSPMTNGMISGHLVSTILTLFVIPSLYVLMVEKVGMQVSRTSTS